MNMTYHCLNCEKRFYFYGKTAKALSSIILAKSDITEEQYFTGHVQSAYKIIQNNAKCCTNPFVSRVLGAEFSEP